MFRSVDPHGADEEPGGEAGADGLPGVLADPGAPVDGALDLLAGLLEGLAGLLDGLLDAIGVVLELALEQREALLDLVLVGLDRELEGARLLGQLALARGRARVALGVRREAGGGGGLGARDGVGGALDQGAVSSSCV